jgi:ferric-dicitrate binding protein FerR (iron transport regulator)
MADDEMTDGSTRRDASDRDGPLAKPVPARTGLKLSLGALLVAGIFALKEAVFWSPPLTFTVGSTEQSGVLGDWEAAPDDARLPLRFSDGTRVELEPHARARVVAVGRAGAEVVIESGRAHVRVEPVRFRVPGESPWRVNLGPFSVEVTGTRFDVEWDPRADQFSLDLLEGSVQSSGCDGLSHTLVAGQGIRASCSRKQWAVVSLADATGTGEPNVDPPHPETNAAGPNGESRARAEGP